MTLPIEPPLKPMLARVRDEIPDGDGWLFEPKWDGFRTLVFRDGDELQLISRDGRGLRRYFPELVEPLLAALPERCVVDGEIVVASGEGLDFDALLLRIHPAESRVRLLAREFPTSFVAFDLVALDDDDLSDVPFAERRQRLERVLDAVAPGAPEPTLRILGQPGSQVVLTPQTDRRAEALEWFSGLEAYGLDGVIAKPDDVGYVPGERVLVKVKHKRTADCVVGGYRLSKSGDGIGSLLLGVYDDAGVLHYVGHTSSFKAAERRRLLAELRPLEGGHSFGGGRAPGGPSRWSHGKDVSWTPLEPRLVCEVLYEHLQGNRFRHAARFLRWRDDKDPKECTFDQLRVSR